MFTVGLFLRVRWLDVRLRYDVASMGTLGLITLNDADEVSPCHTREPRSTARERTLLTVTRPSMEGSDPSGAPMLYSVMLPLQCRASCSVSTRTLRHPVTCSGLATFLRVSSAISLSKPTRSVRLAAHCPPSPLYAPAFCFYR